MEEFIEFLINNGLQLLYLVLTTFVSYLTIKIKNLYNKYVTDEMKKSVTEICVKACEQLYKGNDSEEKYNLAFNNIKTMLKSKNIKMDDEEIKLMIESFCHNFRKDENHEK
ncbi:hypothetical protein EGP95_05730 [bacterium]|nr:hypothetical protein [bacterium]MBD9115266.1 hypothetical protein [bacterium]